jgi:2-dehydro-3-deoxygluconokinase
MLELSRADGALWSMGYGGDSLNVATYVARLGGDIAYLTALGEDKFSADMKAAWAADGMDTSLVLSHQDRVPGLYAIETDAQGERSFTYWRGQSAARDMFACAGLDAAFEAASKAKLIYLSGITLSLFGPEQQARLVALAKAVRAHGGDVAFDTNYRPKGWASAEQARSAIAAIAPYVSIALPTFEDEAALFGDASPKAIIDRWSAHGASLIAVKLGGNGALVSDGFQRLTVASRTDPSPIDTTGAGDSFNGAFLAAFMGGASAEACATAGNELAATVIRHRGAIIPREAMPAMELAA